MKLFNHQSEALNLTADKNRVAVKDFEGLYDVDIEGNVYSIVHNAHRRKRILKQYTNELGYLKVNLYDIAGKCKKKYVHRLVAQAFIPNPDNLPVVNHIDCDKANNHVDNLEWCTQKDNIAHSIKNNLQSNIKVCIYDEYDKKTRYFDSMIKASRWIGKYDNFVCMQRKIKGNEFRYNSYLIKVGDENVMC
jgi:hypothetical protein